MGIVGYAEIIEGQLELPQGYSLEPETVVEEESGHTGRVLLLRRADESVAWVFAFDANNPKVEDVERRSWEDHRAAARNDY